MKWKIKLEPLKTKDKVFLLVPRYCESCGNVYWLRKVNAIYREGFSYYSIRCECGGSMWYSKSMAMEQLRKK